MSITSFGEKILKSIRVNYPIGGLEISDSILRWSTYENGGWKLAGLKLPPGILIQGEIKNYPEFVAAVKTLKAQASSRKSKMPVVVSLGSLQAYTETLSIPILDEDRMDKALELNLQMASPIPFDQVYAGTELIRRDEDAGKMEFLASFVERNTIDELMKALREGGFFPVAIEPRGISLARLIRKTSSFEYNKSYIVMNVDSNGLEFLIIRNGGLHFDYSTSWQDLEQTDKQISLDGFRAVIVRGINQVLNFYKSQWPEPIDSIMLLSVSLSEEIQKIVESNFSFKVKELKLELGEGLTNEWAVSLGAGFRGTLPRKKDNEISLMGWDAKEEYRREQIMIFLSFWRTLVPSVLGILVIAFAGAIFFLGESKAQLSPNPPLQLSSEQIKEFSELETQAKEFNAKVAMLSKLQAVYDVRMVDILSDIKLAADANQIDINKITTSLGGVVNMTGESKAYDSVTNFREALKNSKNISNVNLPFTNIQQSPQGFAFSVSFDFNPSNIE